MKLRSWVSEYWFMQICSLHIIDFGFEMMIYETFKYVAFPDLRLVESHDISSTHITETAPCETDSLKPPLI